MKLWMNMETIKNNDNFKRLFNKAIELRDSSQYKEALDLLNNLLIDGIHKSAIYGMMGSIFYDLNQYENSVRCYQNVLRINPESELASLGLFHSLFNLGKYKEAFNELDRYLNINEPKHYRITIQELYEQINNTTKKYQKDILEKYFKRYFT